MKTLLPALIIAFSLVAISASAGLSQDDYFPVALDQAYSSAHCQGISLTVLQGPVSEFFVTTVGTSPNVRLINATNSAVLRNVIVSSNTANLTNLTGFNLVNGTKVFIDGSTGSSVSQPYAAALTWPQLSSSSYINVTNRTFQDTCAGAFATQNSAPHIIERINTTIQTADPAGNSNCGTITSNRVLNASVQSNTTTCFTFGANNLDLDLAGNTVFWHGGISAIYSANKQNITIRNGFIIDNSSAQASGVGIELDNTSNVSIRNVTILTNGTFGNEGISAYSGSQRIWINNITIKTVGSADSNIGIDLSLQSNNNAIGNSSIETNGTDWVHGIYLSDSSFNIFDNNRIIVRGTGTSSATAAIYLDVNSAQNTFLNNSIQARGIATASNDGIWLDRATRNIFHNNNITVIHPNNYPVLFDHADEDDNVFNNTFISGKEWIYSVAGARNSFLNTTFETTLGRIRLVGNVSIVNAEDVNGSRFNITSTKAFLNAAALPALNKSAFISLAGVTSTNPRVTFDVSDTNTFIPCPITRCTGISFLNNILSFNVTSWSGYGSEGSYDWENFTFRNATVREVGNQTYQLNITWDGALVADVNATFRYNGFTIIPQVESTISNGTRYNRTIYNVTFGTPLMAQNASTRGLFWNFDIGYLNGSRTSTNVSNVTQTVLWTAFITNHTLLPFNILEGQLSILNATILEYDNGADYQVNFTHNNTNYASTIQSNSSTQEVWNTNIQLSGLGVHNFTAGLNTTLYITFNGTTIARFNTTLAPTITQTIWRMILTDCSAGSASTSTTLQYFLYDEDETTKRVTTNSEENHVVISSSSFNRTYSFSRLSRNNFTTCIYPYFTGVNYTTRLTAQSGDGSLYSIRSTIQTLNINLTAQNVTFFLLNLSALNVNLFTITVEDSNGIAQEGLVVEIHRKYLTGSDEYQKVYESITNDDGQIRPYLHTNDVFYKFKIYNTDKSVLLLETADQILFGTTKTITLGAGVLKGWEVYSVIIAGFKSPVTYNAQNNVFNFTYDFSQVDLGNYTINEICLITKMQSNTTYNYTDHSRVCSSTLTRTVLTSATLDRTAADNWQAIAFANITASPAQTYGLGNAFHSFDNGLGLEGFFWAIMVSITVIGVSLWNPAVAVAGGVLVLGMLAGLGVITGWGAGLAFTVMGLGALVVWYLKS